MCGRKRWFEMVLILGLWPGLAAASAVRHAKKTKFKHGADSAQPPSAASYKMVTAAMVDGTPTIDITGPYGDSCTVQASIQKDSGERVLIFPVVHGFSFRRSIPGRLGVTPTRIFFWPDSASDSSDGFAVTRTALPRPANGIQGVDGIFANRQRYTLVGCEVNWWPARGSRLTKQERDRNMQFVNQADREWSNWLSLALTNFPQAYQRFAEMTANLSIPLTAAQQTTVTAREAAGDAAAAAGSLYNALQDYEAALRALPSFGTPQKVEQPLREKIIRLVLRMNPPPAIPQEAMRHAAYAETALEEAKSEGDLYSSVREWGQALRAAPWWADAYYNFGLVLEKLGEPGRAAEELQYYLLAKANAPDAQAVQMKIYSLQYQAKHEAANADSSGSQ